MFFKISKELQGNFSDNFTLSHGFILSTDSHWKKIKGKFGEIYYKGYTSTINLKDFLLEFDPESKDFPYGSFTAIIDTEDKIYIRHDKLRSSRIYYNEKKCIVSSFNELDSVAWSNNLLTIDKKENKLNVDYNSIKTKKYLFTNLDETCSKILDILNLNINLFVKNNPGNIKIPATGGYDTNLLMALLKHNNINFELIDYEYKKWTYFNRANLNLLQNTHDAWDRVGHTWGDEFVILGNGFYADQYFLRDILPLTIYCKFYNIDINKIIETEYKNCYSYQHWNEHRELYKNNIENEMKILSGISDINTKIFDIIHGTYLLGHIDNTIYWSPFKDDNITNHILSMPIELIIDNAANCTIQKKILTLLDKNLANLVMSEKNIINTQSWERINSILHR